MVSFRHTHTQTQTLLINQNYIFCCPYPRSTFPDLLKIILVEKQGVLNRCGGWSMKYLLHTKGSCQVSNSHRIFSWILRRHLNRDYCFLSKRVELKNLIKNCMTFPLHHLFSYQIMPRALHFSRRWKNKKNFCTHKTPDRSTIFFVLLETEHNWRR